MRLEHFPFGRSTEESIRKMPCSVLFVKEELTSAAFNAWTLVESSRRGQGFEDMMLRLLPKKRDRMGARSSVDNGEDIIDSYLLNDILELVHAEAVNKKRHM